MCYSVSILTAQSDWSGYASRSTPVESINRCGRVLKVNNPSFFRGGDKVLLHQTASNSRENVGRCENSFVDTVIGTTIYLTTSIVNEYDATYGLQLVNTLQSSTGRIVDTLHVMPWNGRSGGVLSIDCSDTLVLQGTIKVNGSGEIGQFASSNSKDTATDVVTSQRSGQARNSGGAGGSLAGRGGQGGYQTTAFGERNVGGRSNSILDDLLQSTRLMVGSGGGAGHQNDFHGTNGGNGGGVIIIRAPVIICRIELALQARGTNAPNAMNDGAGGGGSGGTIALFTDSIVGTITADVSGGSGGNVISDIFRHGPGGGGSGGIIGLGQLGLTSAITAQFMGGLNGLSSYRLDDSLIAYGAYQGESGVVRRIQRIATGTSGQRRVRLWASDTLVDAGESTFLYASGGERYVWRNAFTTNVSAGGDTVLTPYVNEPQWFVVEITTQEGCVVVDSIYIQPRVLALPELTISVDNARAKPGDTVNIYVRVASAQQSSRELSGTILVNIRATTLVPVRTAERINDTTFRMRFPFRLAPRTSRTYRRDVARAVLGDSIQIAISIDSVIFDVAPRTVKLNHGLFTLDDVCIDGGRSRLIRLLGPTYSINGRTIMADADELILTDLLGKRIELNTVRTGSRVSAIIPDVATGNFFLTITAAGHRKTVGIIVE